MARALRRRGTEAEAKLWALLRDRRLDRFKFRRQVPIGRHVADFVCYDAALVVELDGSRHLDSTHDKARDAELVRRGFDVLRVWNADLFLHRDGVPELILAKLLERTRSDDAQR